MPPASSSPGSPGFLVIHSNRLEVLRALAVGYIAQHPLPPLAREVLLVQSNGMKNWLEQALADDEAGLGICMGVDMPLPGGFLWEAYRAVLGPDAVPAHLPFDKPVLAWRILQLLPQCISDPAFAPLRGYVANDPQGRRAYQLAVQLADVFDGYQQYRSEWLQDWAAGGKAGAATAAWQPLLWRALRDSAGEAGSASRADVHRRFVQALRDRPADAPRPAGLPQRVMVFGISSLPLQTVQALAELGRCCQVMLFVLNPCRHYWGHIVPERQLLRQLQRHRQQHRHRVPVDQLPMDLSRLHGETHALLATWGRQGRDYLHLLDEFDDSESRSAGVDRIEAFEDPAADPATATRLHRLQQAILDLDPPPATPEPVPLDDSLTVVSCHTALREIEVLHDQLLAWLDADPKLTPNQIMVMVPDIEQFAAAIHAGFGRHRGTKRFIPYAVADASPRRLPVLQALEQLLDLPDSRLTLSQWLGLFEVEAVRSRYELSEMEVASLRAALESAVVRWGRDARHRKTLLELPDDVQGLEQNTWDWGLRRLLLAYASDEWQPWHDVLPAGALSGLEARSLGALATWLDDITTWRERLSQAHSVDQWVLQLQLLLQTFFAARDDTDKRLLQRIDDALARWKVDTEAGGFEGSLQLPVVREHLMAQLEAGSARARFFGGGVQFSTLMPMRSIPFPVICLLGMTDADYPRRSSPRDFDLMAQDFRPGDRSRREDDRYLFLEAVLSARSKLYISWQGNRATDNVPVPPSVVVAQLLEDLALRMAPAPQPQRQPLQPFSMAYFTDSPHFTYDTDWQTQQQTAVTLQPADADKPAPVPVPSERFDVLALRRLLRAPVEVYWRDRLGVTLRDPAEALEDDEPFGIDNLERYRLGSELAAQLQLTPDADVLRDPRLQGRLPLAAAGAALAQDLRDDAKQLVLRAEALCQRYPQLLERETRTIDVAGHPLTVVLEGLRADALGARLALHLRPSRLIADKDALRLDTLATYWMDHVLACAAGQPLLTAVVGMDCTVTWAALPQEAAQTQLHKWQQLWQQAWQTAAPAGRRTACAWLQAARRKPDAADDEDAGHAKAEETWDGTARFTGEFAQSPYLRLSFSDYDDIADDLPYWADALYGTLQRACRQDQPS